MIRYGEGKYGQVHKQQLKRSSGCIIRAENALKRGVWGRKTQEFERPDLTLHEKVRNALLADHFQMNVNHLK